MTTKRSVLIAVLSYMIAVRVILGADMAVIVDFNATGVREHREGNPINSMCTILSVPDLGVKERVLLGENVGVAIGGSNQLFIAGRSIGSPNVMEQILLRYDLAAEKQVQRGYLSGVLNTLDPLFDWPNQPIKANSEFVYALINENSGTSQAILTMDTTGRVLSKYTVPQKEFKLTEFYPFKGRLLLLNIMPSGMNIESTLKLLDTTNGSIVDIVPLKEHVRLVFHSIPESNTLYLMLDHGVPALDKPLVGAVSVVDQKLKYGKKPAAIQYENQNMGCVYGVAQSSHMLLLGVGNGGSIQDLFQLDYEKNTSEKVLSLQSPPRSFTLTRDGRFLLTCGKVSPQVAVYDAATYKFLNKLERVSFGPVLVICN